MVSALEFSVILWLFFLQALLGAFDSFYNHEYKERLPSRPSAYLEQRLHAIREFIYCLLFIGLAWWQWHGVWAIVLFTVLLIEIVVTALDFVEEDRSRVLSPQERVTHLILTISYGAFIALLLPHLWIWQSLPSGFEGHSYSVISVLLTGCGIGVLALGVRNWLSANRLRQLRQPVVNFQGV